MYKNFKQISNIDKSRKSATMLIYSDIGEGDGEVNGVSFAYELQYLEEYAEVKDVHVRINSAGGSVMQAFSIFSAIHNANKRGNINVYTYNDGIAASAAGFILMVGKGKPKVKDYSYLMLHGVMKLDKDGNPITKGLTENQIVMLTSFKDMIVKVFVNNTDLQEAQVNDLMTNGRDNWFTAEEGAAAGFYPYDNIENTGVELEVQDPLKFDAAAYANKAKEVLNNVIKNELKMKKVNAKLGLQEAASEDVTVDAVNKLVTENTENKAALDAANISIKEKDAEIARLKGEVATVNDALAIDMVANGIKEGKLTVADEAGKKALEDQAKADPKAFKNMLSFIATPSKKIVNGIETTVEGATGLLDQVKNRSFRELEREDAKLLNEIKNNAKSEYVKLYNKQYGTSKTEADF